MSRVEATGNGSCVVVGGGPAGLFLGLLLARAGVTTTVLEKHADFLRDFRGDTVHPSTLSMLDDLGIFERFDALPHSKIKTVAFPTPSGEVTVADFSRLKVPHRYIAMVPQWDLLDLLADAGKQEPTYTLHTEHEVTGVIRENGRVVGVNYTSPSGAGQVRADLVVACDGRWSVLREAAGLPSKKFAVGFDTWWFRINTDRKVGESLVPRIGNGYAAVAIPREGYLQIAYLAEKGTDARLRARGVEALRADISALIPEIGEDVENLKSIDDVKHLDVKLERLEKWHVPGLLCIGDSAHAMSPIGGVGINLAVQDAVATARIIAGPLRRGEFVTGGDAVLKKVHRRRKAPTVFIQGLQRVMHSKVIGPALHGSAGKPPPRGLFAIVKAFPGLTGLTARVVGIGPRPETIPDFALRYEQQ